MLKNLLVRAGIPAVIGLASLNAHAAMPTYDDMTAAVDFGAMATAVGLVFVALLGLTIFIAGATIIWNKVKGAKRS